MKHRGTGRRPLALTAAATIALTGLFIGTPAYAETADQPADQPVTTSETEAPVDEAPVEEAPIEDAPAEEAPVEEAPAEDAPSDEVVEAVETAAKSGVEIVAFGVNAAGKDVVVVTEASVEDGAAVKAFTEAAGIEGAAIVTVDDVPATFAEGDVVGGQGYLSVRASDGAAWACSIGFSAYAPDGSAALLSAGHCAFDDNDVKLSATTLSVPGEEPAVGGTGALPDPLVLLGNFGYAEFGNATVNPGAGSGIKATDISVIDIDNAAGWNPLPAVTDWTTAGASLDSLAASTIPVKAVGAATAGAVSKSGRTTGFTTGAIDANDILDGWALIEDRWVQGFSSNTVAGPGDSGGSVIQGTTAVGVISGGIEASPGVEQWTWAASLTIALPKTNGYEVALDLDAPTIATPANGADVTPGQTVSGTAPGATSVIVNQGDGDQTVAVTNGAFSFAGPVALGSGSISVTSANGFSRSDPTTIAVNVEPAPVVAPVISSPANGSTVTATVTSISGTGLPTAAISVVDGEGDPLGTAVVGSTGSWTVTGLDLTYGTHTVVVTQTVGTEVSPEATATFSVVPVAPGVTSIGSGSVFPHDGGPSTLSGTGIDGATITVILGGAEPTSAKVGALAALSGVYTTTVVGGVWSVSFGAPLAPGSYTVSTRQSVAGALSAATLIAFVVSAAPTPGGGAVAPGGNGTGNGNLAETGADAIVPIAGAAAGLALLSGGLLLVVARRRRMIEA